MPRLLFEIRQCICICNNSITNSFFDTYKFITYVIVKIYYQCIYYLFITVYYYKLESFPLVYLLQLNKVCTVLFRNISVVLPRIWRPTLNYTNNICVSAFIEFVQRFSSLNTHSSMYYEYLFNQYRDNDSNDYYIFF